jgi:spermidine/putrescine transport system permease protein
MKRAPSIPKAECLATLPSFVWLALFVFVPTVMVFAIAFKESTPAGGIGSGWSLQTFRDLNDPIYLRLAWRTLWISVVTTAFCLGIGLPAAYAIARSAPPLRATLLLLVMIPFWTNFLIRVFAWNQILHAEGWLARTLRALGLLGESETLLYNAGAVVLVSIYAYLPFAILPLYAAIEKFDFSLLDAARDLGATSRRALLTVFLPGIGKGLSTAIIIVFVPMLGSYVVPDLVGGTDGEMFGTRIAQRNFADRNLPAAAALAAVLTLAVLIPLLLPRRQRTTG